MAQRTEHSPNPETISRGRINWIDIAVILGIAAFSAAWHWRRWRGITPFIFLNSDAANIASFTAAWAHPELFRHDALLSNVDNFRFYATIHIPLLRVLMHFFDDYGSAFMAMLGPHVFVQTLGFYILGRALFKDRFWAVLLVVINLRHMPTGIGADFWGIYVDAIPRITFQAFFPWMLAAAFVWRRDMSRWPWLMGFAGLLMYAHPASAPVVALALWSGLWMYLPDSWPLNRKTIHMFKMGLVFLVVAAPFFTVYLSSHSDGFRLDYKTIYPIIQYRFIDDFLNIPYMAGRFLTRITGSLLLPLGTIAAIVLIWIRKGRTLDRVRLPMVWAAVIFSVSVFIPLLENAIARAYQVLPLEVDLIRAVRYLYPLGLLLCVWAAADLARVFRDRPAVRFSIMLAAVLCVTAWTVVAKPPWFSPRHEFEFIHYRTGPIHPHQNDMIRALEAVRDLTPRGAPVLPAPEANPLAVRYFALHPVSLCYKDGGALAYANPRGLLTWYEHWPRLLKISLMSDGTDKLKSYIELAKHLDTRYILLDFSLPQDHMDPEAVDVIYKNRAYMLVRLR